MHSDKEDTWCCFGGHTIEEEETSISGSHGTICLPCISTINKSVNHEILSAKCDSHPHLLSCLQPRILSMFVLTESHGLEDPSFIMPRLFGQKNHSILDFLESVLKIVSEQADAGCNLPENFDNGLVHILHNEKSLCGFTPNDWRHWPKNQHFTIIEENFAGASCNRCKVLAMEKFPHHPAFAQ